MRVGAGRAEVVVGDELQDVGRAEFGNSAVAVEGIMVRLESFDGTHGARATRRRWVIGRGRAWRFGFGAGMGWACRTALMPTVAGMRLRS